MGLSCLKFNVKLLVCPVFFFKLEVEVTRDFCNFTCSFGNSSINMLSLYSVIFSYCFCERLFFFFFFEHFQYVFHLFLFCIKISVFGSQVRRAGVGAGNLALKAQIYQIFGWVQFHY
jgi:hypothetical protein